MMQNNRLMHYRNPTCFPDRAARRATVGVADDDCSDDDGGGDDVGPYLEAVSDRQWLSVRWVAAVEWPSSFCYRARAPSVAGVGFFLLSL